MELKTEEAHSCKLNLHAEHLWYDLYQAVYISNAISSIGYYNYNTTSNKIQYGSRYDQ